MAEARVVRSALMLVGGAAVLTGFAAAPLARSAQDAPTRATPAVVGTWHLDEAASRLDAENWVRSRPPVPPEAPCLPTLARTGEPVSFDCGPQFGFVASGSETSRADGALRTFGPGLLTAPATLTIEVGPARVMIAADRRGPTTYFVGPVATKIEVVTHHSVRWPSTRSVSVLTSWDGPAVVQRLRTGFQGTRFDMVRTFLPASDGRRLFVLINVAVAKLAPPVRPIARIYVRESATDLAAPEGSDRRRRPRL